MSLKRNVGGLLISGICANCIQGVRVVNSIIGEVYVVNNYVSDVEISVQNSVMWYYKTDIDQWFIPSPGSGNIVADSIYDGNSFFLDKKSPCIGAGIDSVQIDTTWYYAPKTDLFGNPRPYPAGSFPDMGAIEHELGSPLTTVFDKEKSIIPEKIGLYQNFPNPFNSTTTIQYSLPENVRVVLKIFNLLGEEISTLVDEFQSAGNRSVVWDGRNKSGRMVNSGVYIYSLRIGDVAHNRKMIMMK